MTVFLHRRSVFALLCALLFGATLACAAEVIPPTPRDHFNDYAGIVNRQTAQQLEASLTQFERDTSNQILVVIYPNMQSDSSIDDYTVRVFEKWKVGRKGISNGAILFIFSQDRRMRIATGYGLEASLPDALCKRILDDEIAPRFRSGDFSGGVRAGTMAMIAATRGEYRGNGRLAANRGGSVTIRGGGMNVVGFMVIFFFILAAIVLSIVRRFLRGFTVYNPRGRRPFNTWTGGGWGGGGWSGGGGGWSGGGGGGSFSGGGGSTGGGGASGSW